MRTIVLLPAALSVWVLLFVPAVTTAEAPPMVNESARQIPVAYQVDVVVVGGSTGAVSAAVAAAEAGARVFLATPYLYLGEDMTATLRLWRDADEELSTPLAREVFTDAVGRRFGPHPNRMQYRYTADRESDGLHADTSPPSRLSDGRWGSASSESVQYNGDVSILADLGEAKPIDRLRVVFYHRGGGVSEHNFKVRSIAVSAGDNPEQLEPVTEWDNGTTLAENPPGDANVTAEIPVDRTARYVRLHVKKTDDVPRILLGELEIIAPGSEPVAEAQVPPMPRPMHVKRVLENALLDAGVEFLFGSYATDVLVDAGGKPAGIVMANRAGRQAVVAKTIIDATPRALVARMAGARFAPFPGGMQTLQYVVIGGEVQTHEGMSAREVPPPFVGAFPNRAKTSSGIFRVIEYTARLNLPKDTPACWAAADQQLRSWTYHPEQQFTSEALFQVPPDPLVGEKPAEGSWSGVEALPIGAFRPADVGYVFVLGGCADVPRSQAARLLRPTCLMAMGERIGKAAATSAKLRDEPRGVHLAGRPADKPVAAGDVKEFLVGVRPVQELPTIPQHERALPVLGQYDVVVVGGGTTGAPAGIGAARQGAKTLVIEFLYGLGGVGTEGAISSYYWGNRVGFTATIPTGNSWVIEQKKQWFREELLKAGADIWFGAIGCGALVQDGRVRGVVVATAQGRGVVLAHAVIDATGNSDIAVAAGAQCDYTDARELAMQGTGLPPRELGASYTNTDFTITDETDMLDIWHLFVYAKDKYQDSFDQGRLIDTRERRRIVGEFTMTLLDQVLGRTYPDTISIAYSNFDSHGYTIDPLLELEHPEKGGFHIRVPYRSMLPKGLEGILVGGLGTSMHRDAVPMTRMQADLQNQGYAAGVAAAMASKAGIPLRQLDIRAVQRHLVEIGNLPDSVLEEVDNFPLPPERLREAIESVKDNYHGVAALLVRPDDSLPLLREAYQKAEDPKHQLIYAHILAVLGDSTGLDTLIQAVRSRQEWDAGWDYRGMGQFGHALSDLDRLIMALGRTRNPEAVPAILEKLEKLTPESEFSHFRAVGLALELIGDRRAAPPLAGTLSRPGMTGYVHDTLQAARQHAAQYPGTNAVGPRRDSLRELLLARALYRCGDYGNMGEQILRAYVNDLRGHLARHAKAVLEAAQQSPPNKQP